MALSTLISDVRFLGDAGGASIRHTDAQITRRINQAIQAFRRRISDTGSQHYLVSSSGTLGTAPTSPYPFYVLDLSGLSPALVHTYGIDVTFSGGHVVTLGHVPFEQRAKYGSTQQGGEPVAWAHFRTAQVAILPASSTAYAYTVWYLPVLADLSGADTFDGVAGWEEYVTADVVCDLIARDQFPLAFQMAAAQRDKAWESVIRDATKVSQAGGAHVGRDSFGRKLTHFLGGSRPSTPVGGGPSSLEQLFGNGVRAGDRIEWSGTAWVQRRGWITPGVDITGGTDATATILAALQSRTGVCVQLPTDGIVRMNSGLTLPAGTALVGSPRGLRQGHRVFTPLDHDGLLIKAYGTGTLFTLSQNSTIDGFEIYYPNQQTNAAPDVYGYTFTIPENAHFCNVLNCSVPNAYNLLSVAGANGVTVDCIMGFPLNRGVYLGRVADVARISRVHFNPTAFAYDIGATLEADVLANASAFVVDGAEEFAFTDCFAYGYNFGLQFIDEDADSFRGTYGSWKGGGLDICNACIKVSGPTGLCALGLRMSDCGLVPNTTGQAINAVDTAAPSSVRDRPRIMLSNVSVHGTSDRVALIAAGSYTNVTWHGGHVEGYTNPAFLAGDADVAILLDAVSRSASGALIVEPAQPGLFIDDNPLVLP